MLLLKLGTMWEAKSFEEQRGATVREFVAVPEDFDAVAALVLQHGRGESARFAAHGFVLSGPDDPDAFALAIGRCVWRRLAQGDVDMAVPHMAIVKGVASAAVEGFDVGDGRNDALVCFHVL